MNGSEVGVGFLLLVAFQAQTQSFQAWGWGVLFQKAGFCTPLPLEVSDTSLFLPNLSFSYSHNSLV